MLNLTRFVYVWLLFGLLAWLVFGLAVLLMFGSVVGLAVGLVIGLESGLIVGLIVFISGLMFGRHRAWLAYVWASWRLSREGVLPRKLMPFLVDMHRLGLLRAVGRVYQFRHAELQDHLAETYRRSS